ncbi:MAG: Plug and carboxypeptidase regulatory-like domain-containing protein, partial [Acidobacteriaceae bacterium]|nr:Plug and carboxypeptidase regulatory-like domain-containing protein [Acidobacteriaceae bacterium]
MTKLRFGIAVAILLLLSQIGSAQTIMSPLSGTVTDASGAVLVDANVTVTNMANNITNNTVTNQKGQFVFPSLPPATYKVLVDKEGFKTYQRTGIVMTANNPVSLGMIALQVGSVVDKIEVHSEGEALQTQTAAVGTAIVGKQLENIQVNGRSFLGLLRLVPGVYSDGAFQSPSNQTGNVTANGSRGQQFNITINGASNLDTGSNTKMYSTISLDAVQEFRVMTSSYQAEFGKTSGAQISVVTKSGTDTFHGGAYWYYRDKGLNATNWDNKRRNMAKAAYHYNFFGYTLGGPVFVPNKFNANKDKLFFFWYNEFQQMVIPHGVKTVTLPTDEERHGNFSNSVNSSGNPVTIQDCIHRDAANNCVPFVDGTVTGQIPAAYQYGPGMALLDWLYQIGQGKLGQTVPGQKGYNFQSAISDTNPRVEGLLRMDYNFSPRIKIYGTWSPLFSDTYTSYYCPSGSSLCTNLPLTPIHYAHPGFVLAGTVVQTFSPSLVNETTVDWGKHPVTIAPEKADVWTRAGTGVKLDTMYSPYMDWMPNINFSGAIGNAPRLNDGSGGAWTPY